MILKSTILGSYQLPEIVVFKIIANLVKIFKICNDFKKYNFR